MIGRLFRNPPGPSMPAAVADAQVRLDEAEAVLTQIYEQARTAVVTAAVEDRAQGGCTDALLDIANAVKAYRGVA